MYVKKGWGIIIRSGEPAYLEPSTMIRLFEPVGSRQESEKRNDRTGKMTRLAFAIIKYPPRAISLGIFAILAAAIRPIDHYQTFVQDQDH